MKPFFTTQRVLVWFVVCPADKNSNRWKKIAYHIFTLVTFFSILFAYFAYFVKFKSIHLDTSLYAVLMSIFVSGLIFLSMVMFAYRHKISNLMNKLSDIYNSSKLIGICILKKTCLLNKQF